MVEKVRTMKMYSKDGVEMMDIYSLEKVGSNLVLQGRILQSMSATIYLRPEEVLKAMKLLTWPVVLSLPIIIVKGFWRLIWAKKSN
jgi:hypothetical protein